MQIEFTDRYGPAGPPSWLRGCHGDCEAMGFYPTQEPQYATLDEDGWAWVRCQKCDGTGLCSWPETLRRLPRWVVRGFGFVAQLIRHPEMFRQPAPPWWRRAWTAIQCTYLADLGLWRP
jgi:hypothetical protein